MRVRSIAIILGVVTSLSSARAAETPARQADEREAIHKGLAYVEGKSLSWLRQRKCASCHHVPMMVWAQRDARQRGFKIDEKGLQEAMDFLLAADNRANVVPNPGDPDRPGNSFSLMAAYTILAFRDGGREPEAAAQEIVKKASAHVLSEQQADGSWPMTSRPPNSGAGNKGAGNLEPITVAGSAWAVLGLLQRTGTAAAVQGQDKPATPAEQYKALCKEHQAAIDARSSPRQAKVTLQFLELAEKNPKDHVAVDALIQVVGICNGTANPAGKDSPGGRALAILLRDHLRSEKLGEACQRLTFGFREEYETFLHTVLEKNPHREVRGLACLALAHFLKNRSQRVDMAKDRPDVAKQYASLFGKDYLDTLRRQDREITTKKIEAHYEQAAAQYGDVKVAPVWAGEKATTVGEKAKAEFFAIRDLAIGSEAPDIEGVDEDGKRFKLTDYRGKVVLLYFWHQD